MSEIKKEALEFLFYGYLGITPEEIKNNREEKIKDDVLFKCAKRAYLDLCRTLRFADFAKGEKQQDVRDRFVDDISNFIVDKVNNDILKSDKLIYKDICTEIKTRVQNYKENDKKILEIIKHSTTCNGKDKDESFYYGQAQKWLNMTIKYMWLTGFWDSEFELDSLKDRLHIPVDSYIMRAASEQFNIEIPKKDGNKGKYRLNNSKSWSQWNFEDYIEFQKQLRTKCKEEGKVPIEWEGPAWITIAEEIKGKR